MAAFFLLSRAVAAAPYGLNLLTNGDAESGPASSIGAPMAVPGWNVSAAFTVVPYGASGFPTASQGPPDGMNQFFAGGNNAATSTATQDIDVSANAADIDAGHVAADASGWFGGFANQDDDATLTINFTTNAMAQLGSFTIGGVTAADRQLQTQLLNRGGSMFVPSGTRIIHVVLTMTRKSNVGPFNDGYADSLKLSLRGPGVVTTTANSGVGSLRDRLANTAYLTFDPNVFGPGSHKYIVLDEPELPAITGAMTIVGPGAARLSIARYDGFSNGTSPILIINSPAGTKGPVTISGVELVVGTQNNNAGPAITTNDAYAGTLTVRDSIIRGPHDHDGINAGFQTLLLASGCTFTAASRGILCWQNATILNCTFSGNVSGLVVQIPPVAASITIDSCTFGDNTDAILFARTSVPTSAITVTVLNSIFQSTHLDFNDDSSASGTKVVSGGFNLSTRDDSAILKAAGDRNNTDPKLAPLGDYGGQIPTRALLPGSPAIDRGNTTLTRDQRALPRPVDDPNSINGGGNNSDIGAFELQAGEAPTPAPSPSRLANISTRLPVQTGDNVLIGGFIITGGQPKNVIIRAIGPSLPLPGALADPTLELHDGSGALLESNDNWVDSPNKQLIISSTIPPMNNKESAIVRTLPANGAGYTAVVRGVNNTTGIGVVEVYDLDSAADSKLANISTRGFVQGGDNVLIAGDIVVGQTGQKVIIRALGPSVPVPGAMADPSLELHDANGALIEANDNWVDSPNKQAIIDSMIPPPNNLESAIVRTLSPANYTAIVRGANNTTGIAVVEVYALN